MKKLLAWVKGNLLVVVFSAIILLVLPASYFVSSGWNKSVRDNRQKEVDGDAAKLKVSVTYTLPSIEPGKEGYSYSGAPNAYITKQFVDKKKSVEAQADGVVKAAQDFNSRNHRDQDGKLHVLVDGLLPSSSGPDYQSKARRLIERVVGTESQPSIYKALFDSINAKEPLSGTDLATRLADANQREVDLILGAQPGRQLAPDEQAKITKSLVEKRKAITQSYARNFSVYGTPAAVSGFVPVAATNDMPPIKRCFELQADVWLVEDLLAAVKAANTGPDGQALSVGDAVVKRIEKIMPKPSVLGGGMAEQQPDAGHEEGAAAAPAAASPAEQVAPDFTRSITGRWSGPGNGVYDVRKVEMVVVVSSKNLPKFIDAVSRTNFMTVTDCDLFDVDVWADLDQGYYYGEESVVRARVEIESVWLRSWTTAFMPKDIKAKLGIPEPETPADGEKKPDGPG